MMKLLYVSLLMFFVSATVTAQQTGVDSVALAKKTAKIAKLTSDIAAQKEELAKTEAALVNAQQNNSSAEARAAEAADDNAKLAERLQGDPTDKRLSRKARKAAKSAKRNARRGRKAESSMESYDNKVERLRKSIAEDEKDLAELTAEPGN